MLKYITFFLLISFAYGIVENVRVCGGSGRFDSVSILGCSSQPCLFQAGELYPITIVYSPSESGPHSRFVVSVIQAGIPIPIIDTDIEGNVDAGQDYALDYNLLTSNEMAGQLFDIRASVFSARGTLELCGEITVRVLGF